ncbi:MAG: DUF4411 family protein [Bauldia sp.]
MPSAKVYCIDSSSLIHAWRRAYPPHRFAPVWQAIEGLIDDGRLRSSIEVFNELGRKDDDIFAWAKARKDAFLEIDDGVQDQVVRIMAVYPRLVDTVKGRSGADPFVIAQAMVGQPAMTVVTQEGAGGEKSPKIPYVCQREGLRSINLLELIEEEDWTF